DEVERLISSLTLLNPIRKIERMFTTINGEQRWLIWSLRALFDAEDKPVEYQVVGRDITESKITENELIYQNKKLVSANEEISACVKDLSESKQQFADIIEFLPDATLVINMEGTVIAWNRAMEEMTGVAKNEIIGQGDHAYTVPFYGERIKILLDLIELDDEEIRSKYQYVQRKGNTLYAEIYTPMLFGGKGAYLWATATPLFDIHGTRIGAIESIRDISEQKAEKELRASLSRSADQKDEIQK
ncbi:MAG: hypothetical protein CVU88_07490, partial [Firmicutes bacterium HGW-Firmicutes-13]